MNSVQSKVVSLLNAGIYENKLINFNVSNNIDWESIIEECKAHKIEGIVYSALNKDCKESIKKDLLDRWKMDTFMTGISQINHINQVGSLFEEFKKCGIPVIALKGLVVRDLYPKKELRSMSDADILVKPEDIDRSRDLLLSLGYDEVGASSKHVNFVKGSTYIELHWSIADDGYFEDISFIEDGIWKNAVKVNVGSSEALSMCDEDLALHLCIHMIDHIKHLGFGIRQVCDLALLVEKRGSLINWDSFYNKCKLCKIDKFVITIFMVCNKLFEMKIPNVLSKDTNNRKYVDLLISDIFKGGVYGKRDLTTSISNGIANIGYKNNRSFLGQYIDFFFPTGDLLVEKYSYAKKYKMLLPIAWIHRMIAANYSIIDKMKVVVIGISISKKRNKLLNLLEI